MDGIWKAREKKVKDFCVKNNIENLDIIDIAYDPEYGEIAVISPFICILPDGTKMIEWP